MKIRSYLVMMVIAILVPVIVFSAISLNTLLMSERTAALRGLHETARATALIVDRELGSAEASLRALAMSPHLTSGDMRGFYALAKAADWGTAASTLLYDQDGRQLINTLLPVGAPLLPRQAEDQQRISQVLQARQTVVSRLIEDAGAPPKLLTTVNVPVTLPDGRQYVVASVFSTEYFQNIIAQRQIPPEWIVALIDDDGRFIARSHKAEQLTGKPARPELLNAARLSREGEIRHNTVEGIESYDVFTHPSMSAWTVAVAAPVELIESAARQAVVVAALGLMAAVICATGAAILFGRRLVRSVNRAARSAAALGRGEAPALANSGVTEVDELHVALNHAGTVLHHSLAERAKLLASEQEARRLAEQQNKAKDEFLAMLGHELRNPLSAIASAIAVMEVNGAGPEKLGRARTIIGRQSKHLARIVDDLLDLSRLSTGKILLSMESLDLAGVVQSCVDVLRTAERTDSLITVHVQSVWINADRTRLEQIINNLLNNALKYTPAGGLIEVQVTADSNEAVLQVRDSGVGIAPELLPQLFNMFVQGAVSIDRAQGGLGIGLALVRQLTTLHGGTVSAESAGIGKGSTFTVRFPRVAGVQGCDPKAGFDPATVDQQRTVLLIEDNDDARQMTAVMLTLHACQVLEASNGIDGIRLATEHKPDVAIVDIGLSGIDGYEIARRLRADPATKEIGLIALTGYGQQSDRKFALNAGFDEHLVKPVDLERLIKAMRAVAVPADANRQNV
ncbi:MAG: ATP-binding protein [Pseudomonadota bacterium]